jgi:hypothetical protein
LAVDAAGDFSGGCVSCGRYSNVEKTISGNISKRQKRTRRSRNETVSMGSDWHRVHCF